MSSSSCSPVAHNARQVTRAAAPAQLDDGNYVSGIRRVVYIALAGFFLLLAMLGIALPGLPTTPFLLLTSYFLARSWPRMHRLLLTSRLLGPMLRHWQQHRALERRTKLKATALVGIAAVVLICFSGLPYSLTTFLVALIGAGLLVIYRLPTLDSKQLSGT